MARRLEKVYAQLPVFAQNWAISAYGYTWQKRRFGGIFEEELRGFKEREFFSEEQWRVYQTLQLRRILTHAFETVPFYRAKYQALGFRRSDFEHFELEDLPRLPFLEKEELRRFGTSTLISTKREKGGQFFSSSGSTGTPTQILYSHAFHQRVAAAMEARVRNWAGVTQHTPRGMIGGRRILPKAYHTPPFYRFNYFEQQTYFSAYHISKRNAMDYVEGMRRHGVEYMTGYAMSNYFLAAFLEELNQEVPLKAVITSSEKLSDQMRETFKRVYGCQTFDSYSGVENCGLISETSHGEIVIQPDVGIMEVLDDLGNMVQPGGEGEVVSTGLLNFDQPLIRYRIGDRVRISEVQHLEEGRAMVRVEEITGRVEDVIVTRDGRTMVRFHGIFTDIPSILEGQIIQHTLDTFTVKVVAKSGFGRLESEQLIERMQSQLGVDSIIKIERCEKIPRTSNGKFKAVISEIV